MVAATPAAPPTMKFASTVRVGDHLVSGRSGPTKVTSVTSRLETGVYSPLVATGTLLVDDLLASCYADWSSHDLAHLATLPYRLLPQLLKAEVGVTLSQHANLVAVITGGGGNLGPRLDRLV